MEFIEVHIFLLWPLQWPSFFVGRSLSRFHLLISVFCVNTHFLGRLSLFSVDIHLKYHLFSISLHTFFKLSFLLGWFLSWLPACP